MKHKDHPLNGNKIIGDFYANKSVLWRANSTHCEGMGTKIEFRAFPIVKYTPCGVVINNYSERRRFVNLRAGKQWASANMNEAVDQLRHRKRAQVRILRNQLANAEEAYQVLNLDPAIWERLKGDWINMFDAAAMNTTEDVAFGQLGLQEMQK